MRSIVSLICSTNSYIHYDCIKQGFCLQEKEEEEAEQREREYAAKMEAERLGLMEGGSGPADLAPKENGTLPESSEINAVPEVMVQNTVPVIPS